MKKKSYTKTFETTKEMDEYLENADLGEDFKLHGVLKPPLIRKINLDLTYSMVEEIDKIASKIGVSRQPLLKVWIHERLKAENLK